MTHAMEPGLWAIEPAYFQKVAEKAAVEKQELPTVLRTAFNQATGIQGYTAIIPLSGLLIKDGSDWACCTSTRWARNAIAAAAADASCVAVLLLVDSPGGMVAGIQDLVQAIQNLADVKPCWAFVEDLCASAAYWAASGCQKIFANNGTALVGSIGTYGGLYDISEMLAKAGVRLHLYSTGALKGAGTPGVAVTPEQDAYFQNLAEETQKFFSADVMARRRMSPQALAKVSTGAVFLAEQAELLGLIDGIQSFAQTVADLEAEVGVRRGGANAERGMRNAAGDPPKGGTTNVMAAAGGDCACTCEECQGGTCDQCSCGGCAACEASGCSGCQGDAGGEGGGDQTKQAAGVVPAAELSNKEPVMGEPSKDSPQSGPKAASLQELKAALPKSTAEFREKCQEDKLTLADATARYVAQQDQALEASAQTIKDLEAKGTKLGAKTLTTGAAAGGKEAAGADAGDFNALVAQAMDANPKLQRRDAIKQVARANPEAHKAYVAGCPKGVAKG